MDNDIIDGHWENNYSDNFGTIINLRLKTEIISEN
jgi:hypothetical protein